MVKPWLPESGKVYVPAPDLSGFGTGKARVSGISLALVRVKSTEQHVMQVAIANNVRHLRRPAAIDGARRMRARMPARLKLGVQRSTCTVTDVSRSGACLNFAGQLDLNEKIWLIVENLPPIEATPVWRKRDRVGLKFERDQEWVYRLGGERAGSYAPSRGHVEKTHVDRNLQNDWKEF